ncbi:MAG: hypothetical protein JWR04_1642 [Rhodoglobus sp.]|nr:hypothetical protein [Rhodoglobus sp.]
MDSGYSGTPQLKKLGIAPGVRLDVVGAPEGWRFESDPVGVEQAAPDAPADVIVAFCRSAAEVRHAVEAHEPRIRPAGALWIVWPRKAAGHVSDVTENLLREVALPRGLVDVKVAAVDADWSGVKLVWRRENR